jgi:hypothetical protein
MRSMPENGGKQLDNVNCITIVMTLSRLCKDKTGFAGSCSVTEMTIVNKLCDTMRHIVTRKVH